VKKITKILKEEGVGILATDTLYGIVGSALSKQVVTKIYALRKRRLSKPMIILIGSLDDLSKFGIKLTPELLKKLQNYWPGKVSVILPCPSPRFFYLHRGKKTLAFRLPTKKSLVELLKKTGPLVAPSANIEGQPPATNIKEAHDYFGNKVDFYRRGIVSDKPSRIIELQGDKLNTLR